MRLTTLLSILLCACAPAETRPLRSPAPPRNEVESRARRGVDPQALYEQGGEHLLAGGETHWAQAEVALSQVVLATSAAHPLWERAHYMLGLVRLNRGNHRAALGSFAEVACLDGLLRSEAILHLGFIATEPDWDGDGEDDDVAPWHRPEVGRLLGANDGLGPQFMKAMVLAHLESGRVAQARDTLTEFARRFPTEDLQTLEVEVRRAEP